jgi:hypothetical protein
VTTYTDFVPSNQAPFQFQPTLDGAVYTALITWNLARGGWYITLYDLNGTRILTLPLIGSPTAVLTSSITWDVTRQLVTVTSAVPHGLKTGTVAEMTVFGALPDVYNRTVDMYAVNAYDLTYPETTDPGSAATSQGYLIHNINLVAGYFSISTLVYRADTKQFEVTP